MGRFLIFSCGRTSRGVSIAAPEVGLLESLIVECLFLLILEIIHAKWALWLSWRQPLIATTIVIFIAASSQCPDLLLKVYILVPELIVFTPEFGVLFSQLVGHTQLLVLHLFEPVQLILILLMLLLGLLVETLNHLLLLI